MSSLDTEQVKEILKLDNQLCFPLYAASRLIIQAYGPSLETLKITYPQYLVLMVLWENDGLSVKNIGDKLLLDSGTITPLLQKLSSLGFVERSRSEIDNRAVQNYLTKSGKALRAKAAEMSYAIFCNSGLTMDEAVNLRTSVKDLLAKLNALVAQDPQRLDN